MKLIKTAIKDLVILEPTIFNDQRGYFFESYNKKTLNELGLEYNFVQDNQSLSEYGVLRGLHFQKNEFAQSKLIRVLDGEIFDVAIDIRPNSNTYGKHFGVTLSSKNQKQLLIPRGFAHGFVVTSQKALISYKCDNYYNKNFEAGIHYKDPDLNISWPVEDSKIIVNKRDNSFPELKKL